MISVVALHSNTVSSAQPLGRGYYAGGQSSSVSFIGSLETFDYNNFSTALLTTTITPRSLMVGWQSNIKGYFAGGVGSGGTLFRNINSVDFYNNSVSSLTALLAIAKSSGVGVSSVEKGYYVGGVNNVGTTFSVVEAFTFSTQTVSPTTFSYGSQYKLGASTKSSTKGYFAGGDNSISANISTVKALVFDTEVVATLAATLLPARNSLSGLSASNVGYFVGGTTSVVGLTAINAFDYSTETMSVSSLTLTFPKSAGAGVSNTSAGYFAGGTNNKTSALDTIEGLNFDTVVKVFVGTTLKTARYGLVGATYIPETVAPSIIAQPHKGYYAGGYSGATLKTYIEYLDFDTDTFGSVTSATSLQRIDFTSVNSTTTGYYLGGTSISVTTFTYTYTVAFNTETLILTASSIPYVKELSGGSTSTHGYFSGGINFSGAFVNAFTSLNFSSNTYQNPSVVLSVPRARMSSAFSSRRVYFAGGYTQSLVNSTEIGGVDVASLTAFNSFSFLTTARKDSASVSSNLFGYFAGGINNNIATSQIEILNFLNESISVSQYTLTSKSQFGASNSNVAGYFAGGSDDTNQLTSAHSLDFVTNATSLLSSTMSQPVSGCIGTSPLQFTPVSVFNNRGYFAGGSNLGNFTLNIVDGISFATEASLKTNAKLSVPRTNLSSVESVNTGYFAGGSGIGTFDTVDGINFAVEVLIDVGVSLVQKRFGISTVNTADYGYFAGGYSVTIISSVEKFAFNDESITTSSATLTVGKTFASGVYSNTKGYFAGGLSIDYIKTIDSLTFANDTITLMSATLTNNTCKASDCSFINRGFIVGGYINNTITNIATYFIFASETITQNGTFLSVSTEQAAGTETTNKGYFAGGNGLNRFYSVINGVDNSSTVLTTVSAALSVGRTEASGVSSPTAYNTSIVIGDLPNRLTEPAYVLKPIGVASGNAGYIAQGFVPSPPYVDPTFNTTFQTFYYVAYPITKINFTSFAVSNMSFTLPTLRAGVAGVNSSTKGYYLCGRVQHSFYIGQSATVPYIYTNLRNDFLYISAIDSILFSSETTANVISSLVATGGGIGISSVNIGYSFGGFTASTLAQKYIQTINFSTEVSQNTSAVLFNAIANSGGFSSTTKGYVTNGSQTIVSGVSYTVPQTLNFSNSSVGVISIAGAYRSLLTVSCGLQSSLKGYFVTVNHAISNLINNSVGLIFSTETSSSTSFALRTLSGHTSSVTSPSQGFVTFDSVAVSASAVEGFDYSSETNFSISASIPYRQIFSGDYNGAGTSALPIFTPSTSTQIGYFACGYTVGNIPTNTVDALDYTNDTQYSPTLTMDNAAVGACGMSSNLKGYVAGGQFGINVVTNMSSIIFATKTSAQIISNLQTGRVYSVGTSSLSKGYVVGGKSSVTTFSSVETFQFNNEAVSPSLYNISAQKAAIASCKSLTLSYISGGIYYDTLYGSIDSLNFGNDTVTAKSFALTVKKYFGSGLNSLTKGYFTGGYTVSPAGVANTTAIAFFDETVTTNSTAISTTLSKMCGVSSTTKGYLCCGKNTSNVFVGVGIGTNFATETQFNLVAAIVTPRSDAATLSTI